MSEKLSEVYKEYDMEVFHTQRGRGATILKTNNGIKQLKPLSETEGRLGAEYEFKESLVKNNFYLIDRLIVNKDDGMVTYDKYNNPHVLREYYEGNECDVNNINDIRRAIQNLAAFHKASRKVYEENEVNIKIRRSNDFGKRNRELKRIKNYMLNRSPKREFEEVYLKSYDVFYNKSIGCENEYDSNSMGNMQERCGYCHGTYDYHCLIYNKNNVATVNFSKFYIGNQLDDLYHFIRKVMEKNKYNFEILCTLLEEYDKSLKLNNKDYEYIYILYNYPEKFYKISNQYMNSTKNWISPKMLEKLKKVINDEDSKNKLLDKYVSFYLKKNMLY